MAGSTTEKHEGNLLLQKDWTCRDGTMSIILNLLNNLNNKLNFLVENKHVNIFNFQVSYSNQH